ncbi:MAG: M48 family metalloprotease [Cyanobacteria bacterium SID2]|nr:M48 family metalloprotease [Cyanobacteria bacterium SID2]MBP0005317.1 M48 family metalloprotease [Cyanobacteria bacterium SBC]
MFRKRDAFKRPIPYVLLSAFVAIGVLLTSNPAVLGFSIWDVLPSAVQVVQLSTMSDEQEVAIGSQINDRLLENDIALYQNSQVVEYVDRIGQRLVRVSDRADLPFTFQVVEDDRVNAFATLGGFVYVHTGLLREAENEAELAGVIAHEIGHIVERHAIEKMKQAAIAQGLLNAAGIDADALVQIGYELAIRRPSSRSAEYEADDVGLALIESAGYAPIGMVNFYHKLTSQPSAPEFLSTHPNTNDRIVRLQRQIDLATATRGDGLDREAYRRQIQSLL